VAWYDDIFDLHDIPTRADSGLWWGLRPPPDWHSGVKTTSPGVDVERIASLPEPEGVADSFGDLDLRAVGYRVLIDATWVHHAPLPRPPSAPPHGWRVVREPGLLARWNDAHDYAGVLLPAVLDRPAFSVLARGSGAELTGGAVVHQPAAAGIHHVGLSNAWSGEPGGLDQDELLSVVAALHPGAGVSDYAAGAELGAMLAAGYVALGPHLVWCREESSPSGKTEVF
jgi:hypothetical protein